jgi:hypothetical protein
MEQSTLTRDGTEQQSNESSRWNPRRQFQQGDNLRRRKINLKESTAGVSFEDTER